MDKIIVYSKDQPRTRILSKEWENSYQFQSIPHDDPIQLLRELTLENNSVRGIVVLSGEPEISEVLKNSSALIHIPPILYETSPVEAFNSQIKIFFEHLKISLKYQGQNKEYVPIHFYEFMTFGIAPCDVFLKMGISNHVKIINKGDLYTREILDHYRHKKIDLLYIKKADLEFYLSDLYENIRGRSEVGPSTADQVSLNVARIDFVHTSLLQIGVDEKAIEITKETIQSVLKTLSLRPELYLTIKDYLSVNSYLTEHSIGIATIACAIARGMKLDNQFTLKKLVIAALLHDISLKSLELSLIVNMDTNEYRDLTDDKKREYSEHIYQSIDFLNKIPDLPANVESIILEHHERPNGNGFPRGLDSFTITPLSCIFILAEEFVHHLLRNNFDSKNRDFILEKMSHEFSRGNFKAPMSSLLRLFI